jgi:hypothetical protein
MGIRHADHVTPFIRKRWHYTDVSLISNPDSRQHLNSRDPSRLPRGSLYPQKLALTSPTSAGCSVGIVRSQTQATD